MEKDFIKDLEQATNVYRTEHYIVLQDLIMSDGGNNEPILISRDTYYLRTILRDFHYLAKFQDRKHLNGKRLHSTTYIRRYID